MSRIPTSRPLLPRPFGVFAAVGVALAGLAGCASQPKTEWVKQGVAWTEAERRDAVAGCGAEAGPDPNDPMNQITLMRDCMHRKGWVRAPVATSPPE